MSRPLPVATLASTCAAALVLSLSSPARAGERADLTAGVEAFRAADFATAIRLLEPLGDAAALGELERARALGTLGLALLATGERDRAVAPLRRLAILAPGVRLGTEELAPEYRDFFEELRRDVLASVQLSDRTRPDGPRGLRLEVVLRDPLGVVARVEARGSGRAVPLAATDLGARGQRVLAATIAERPDRYSLVAIARDGTAVAQTDPVTPPRAARVPRARPPSSDRARGGTPWLWPAVAAAAAAAVVVVSVVLLAGDGDPGREGCGSLGCLEF